MAGDIVDLTWKSLYASDVFKWRHTVVNGKCLYYRRLGVVENLFDLDGIDHVGRADMLVRSTFEIRTQLTADELRDRLVLVWTYLRNLHPLMASKSLYGEQFLPDASGRRWIDKHFVYEQPSSRKRAIEAARKHIIFVADAYSRVDEDFYDHAQNTGRLLDAEEALSTFYITPFRKLASGTILLSTCVAAGHEIMDGVSMMRWTRSLLDALNMKGQDLLDSIDALCSARRDVDGLPAAQEALYPVYASNVAKDQWNWAITRILRHVRRPPPDSFPNPLRRDMPLPTAMKFHEKYPSVLNYSKVPPLNSGMMFADLEGRAWLNLTKLCRQAGISVGSGAFTLIGIAMMRLEEIRDPGVPYWKRLPFVGSFPVNPRPFLTGTSTTGKEDSLMLAFSDGVTLPFIPSDLDLVKTFRVLGRLAHRQLRQYQKRKRTPVDKALLGSRSPRELLPSLYLSTMERLEQNAKPEHRLGLTPQGGYPAKPGTPATCGISSIGDISSVLSSGLYDLESKANDLIADLRDFRGMIRPRDGEFLVAAIGTSTGLDIRAAYDQCTIDPAKEKIWSKMIRSLLDFDLDDEPKTNFLPLPQSHRDSKL